MQLAIIVSAVALAWAIVRAWYRRAWDSVRYLEADEGALPRYVMPELRAVIRCETYRKLLNAPHASPLDSCREIESDQVDDVRLT